MKKLFAIISLIGIIRFQTEAQTPLSEKEIIGTWKVVNVGNTGELPGVDKEKVQQFADALQKAKFHFTADHHFSFDFELGDQEIKNVHWKYSDSTKTYLIQEWADKDTDKNLLIALYAKKENNNKIFFILDDEYFILEVKKE